MRLWRVWLVGLTVVLGWLAAILTYIMEWSVGWVFPVLIAALVAITWFSEEDLRQLNAFQAMQFRKELEATTRKLEAQEEITANQQKELDRHQRTIRISTDGFLDPTTLTCQYCGNQSIWFVTPYRFCNTVHAPRCRVVELRSLIETLPLWTPEQFNLSDVLPDYQDDPAILHHPAFADFFLDPSHE